MRASVVCALAAAAALALANETPDVVQQVMADAAAAGGGDEVVSDGVRWSREEGEDGSVRYQRVQPSQPASETVGGFMEQITGPLWQVLNATENAETTEQMWEEMSNAFANITQHLTMENFQGAVSRAGSEMYSHAMQFVQAVDWSETWIRGIIASHAAMWLVYFIIVWGGMSTEIKMGYFVSVGMMAGCATLFNSWAIADDNWKLFSKQKYFDESGAFLAVMWCAPLLLLAFALLISMLLDVGRLLIQVKRKQLVEKSRQKKKEAAEGNAQPAAAAAGDGSIRKRK